jgi:hypothetical protein
MEIPDQLLKINDDIAWDLLALPGVTSVEVGYRLDKGNEVEEPALRVSVASFRNIPKGIPDTVDEFAVSIYEANFDICSRSEDTDRYNEVAGGIRIVSDVADRGTMGAVVLDTNTESLYYNGYLGLTCAHCVVDVNSPTGGEGVWQPSRASSSDPTEIIGYVTRYAFPRDPDDQGRFISNVDAAVFSLTERPFSRRIVGQNGGSDTLYERIIATRRVDNSKGALGRVVKRGSTTRTTYGRIAAIGKRLTWSVMGATNCFLDDQIFIRSVSSAEFAESGDSGSVVFYEGYEGDAIAIGLVVYKGPGFAVASQIQNVENALKISLTE